MTAAAVAPQMPPAPPPPPLLSVAGLRTYFPVKRGLLQRTVGYVKAVDGIDFTIARGQTLGLVGESGCGKSTAGRTILRLIPATAGQVIFDGIDVFAADRPTLKSLRRQMQIIFQDPVGSLNPRMTIGRIIGEPIAVHRLAQGSALHERVAFLLRRVGLDPAYAVRYPHEFSGGQRQRIGIARALALQPRFIVCDEPVSALDVSIQSQVLNLLSDLQDELGLSYLFIAHNLAVVKHFCDRIAVMYLGRIVCLGSRADVTGNPRHPYVQALISAAPHTQTVKTSQRIILPGEVPSPITPPPGCPFHPRCQLTRQLATGQFGAGERVTITVAGQPATVMRRCTTDQPRLEPVDGNPDYTVACWYHQHLHGATPSDGCHP
jgi:oligopeptide/dipeptide ABC transporter ATP-binding protein